MSAKQFPKDLLEQAKVVLDAMKKINPEMVLGDLNATVLSTAINEATLVEARIVSLENQLTDLRNQRQTSQASVWEKIKRVRAGVKAIYGDDSSQYEMVGGTRLSERKSPTRTTTTA